jgi:hypothetical protein
MPPILWFDYVSPDKSHKLAVGRDRRAANAFNAIKVAQLDGSSRLLCFGGGSGAGPCAADQ